MSLGGALQIGRSGLLASQTALEVTGNNLANMATRGYHRQTVGLAPVPGQMLQEGIFVGRGVQITQITRNVNAALEARLHGSIAGESGAMIQMDLLQQLEAIHNEFSGLDVPTHLGAFFNAWSQLALNPQDNSLRTLVVQEGKNLAQFVQTLRTELASVRTGVDQAIDSAVVSANNILEQLATVNRAIVAAERGQGGAHDLRDQRSVLLEELAQYIDFSTVEHSSGLMDVFIGSTPILLNGQSQGLDIRRETINGELSAELVLATDGTPLNTSSGRIGALVRSRRDDVTAVVAFLDDFANKLIFEINRVHSQGQGMSGFDSVTATNRALDATVSLADEAAGLKFLPAHGSFQIHVTNQTTGQRTAETIAVDLDGIGADTSLDSLAAALAAVTGVNASVTPDGRLRIEAATSDQKISFSDDTSGVLAALGINTFFTGSDARDIAVNAVVDHSPGMLAASRSHHPGDNGGALAMEALRQQGLASFGGRSLSEQWHRHVEDYAVRTSQARHRVESATLVRESLHAQQQQFSGVNADEEAINLLTYQRAYQGSARFISVVDEMMETLLRMV